MSRLDYANARIGARRARLLGAGGIRDLLARPDLAARLELLGRLGLLPAEPGRLPGSPDPLGAAELRLWAEVRREGLRLLADAEGRRARALLAAFLELEAPRAVRAVLRGIAAGAPLDEIAAMAPPTPELSPERIRELASCAGAEAVAERLAAWRSPLGPALGAALPGRGEGGPIPAEVALDRAAFGRAFQACRAAGEDARILEAHLRDRVDARNAETLLVVAGGPGEPGSFVEGGRRIDRAAFLRMARLPPEALRAELAAHLRLEPGGMETPWGADRALERAVLAPLRREARSRSLSLAVPLAWLAERRAEVRSVAVALRGAELGLRAEEILSLAEA
jgi:V/A-type H+-transporting ATPase subunit C